jgi:hypothetical protein
MVQTGRRKPDWKILCYKQAEESQTEELQQAAEIEFEEWMVWCIHAIHPVIQRRHFCNAQAGTDCLQIEQLVRPDMSEVGACRWQTGSW